MALPGRFERGGIVVGSVVMISLPVGTLLAVLVPDILVRPAWFQVVAWLLPGTVVGALVASGRLPATYREVWLFSVLAWLLSFGLWQALGDAVPPSNRSLAVGSWALALVLAGLLTWRRAWLLRRVASEPEES